MTNPAPPVLILVALGISIVRAQDSHTIAEREPNDEASAATLVALGSTVTGTINPHDLDYYALDVTAGSRLHIVGADVQFCRDFALLDVDGTTRLAFGDCMEHIDSLSYVVPATGRYFVRVTQFDDAPIEHPMRAYAMRFSVVESGVIDAFLSGTNGALPADVVAQLDTQGNGNGILDIGDLRAYLRAQALLPVPPSPKGTGP